MCGLALASVSHGQILLTVDISDPLNVTFTATGLAPSVDDTGISASAGFTLLGFLDAEDDSIFSGGGTLAANGMTGEYDAVFALDFAGGNYAPGTDLNVFGSTTQNFLTSAPAFTGVLTVNLNSISAILPSLGHSGFIQVGDGDTAGAVIGEYSVIPEPSSVLLVGLSLSLVLSRFRRR